MEQGYNKRSARGYTINEGVRETRTREAAREEATREEAAREEEAKRTKQVDRRRKEIKPMWEQGGKEDEGRR